MLAQPPASTDSDSRAKYRVGLFMLQFQGQSREVRYSSIWSVVEMAFEFIS